MGDPECEHKIMEVLYPHFAYQPEHILRSGWLRTGEGSEQPGAQFPTRGPSLLPTLDRNGLSTFRH